jgi:hypothetical protein
MDNVLTCKRVCYGKAGVELKDREYNVKGCGSTVGTIAEITEHLAVPNGYAGLLLLDSIEGNYTYDVRNGTMMKAE